MDAPTPQQLAAVVEIWKRSGRTMEASFGGTSMLPAIRPGQRLMLECGAGPAATAAVGDVIAFLSNGRLIVHRVADIRRGWILPRGDANILPDIPFSGTAPIIGRVVQVENEEGLFDNVPRAPDSASGRLCTILAGGLIAIHPPYARVLISLLITMRRSLSAIVIVITRRRIQS